MLMTGSFRVVKGNTIPGAAVKKVTTLDDDRVLLIPSVDFDPPPAEPAPPAAYAEKSPEKAMGTWSDTEDAMLQTVVNEWGPKKWSSIASRVSGRSGKQCRERWHNHLNPTINKGAWTPEEDALIENSYLVHGSAWAAFALMMPGRTDNAIKNRFNSHIKRSLASLDDTGKSVVVRFRESTFTPSSPVASSRKKKLESPITDLQNPRSKKSKRTHTGHKTSTPVTFDFGDDYDGCNEDDSLGMGPLQPCDVGDVLAQIVDINDGEATVQPLCLTETVGREKEEDKRGARAKRNLCNKLTNPPDDDEAADWRIMSVIAGFSSDESEEAKPAQGKISFRTVQTVSKIPATLKRCVATPFDSIMAPLKKTDTPAFHFVNKLVMSQTVTATAFRSLL